MVLDGVEISLESSVILKLVEFLKTSVIDKLVENVANFGTVWDDIKDRMTRIKQLEKEKERKHEESKLRETNRLLKTQQQRNMKERKERELQANKMGLEMSKAPNRLKQGQRGKTGRQVGGTRKGMSAKKAVKQIQAVKRDCQNQFRKLQKRFAEETKREKSILKKEYIIDENTFKPGEEKKCLMPEDQQRKLMNILTLCIQQPIKKKNGSIEIEMNSDILYLFKKSAEK